MASWNDVCLALVSRIAGLNKGCSGIVMQYYGDVRLATADQLLGRGHSISFTLCVDELKRISQLMTLARTTYYREPPGSSNNHLFDNSGPILFYYTVRGVSLSSTSRHDLDLFDEFLSSLQTMHSDRSSYQGVTGDPIVQIEKEIDFIFDIQGLRSSSTSTLSHNLEYSTKCDRVISIGIQLYLDIMSLNKVPHEYKAFIDLFEMPISSPKFDTGRYADRCQARINALLDTIRWTDGANESTAYLKRLLLLAEKFVREAKRLKEEYKF